MWLSLGVFSGALKFLIKLDGCGAVQCSEGYTSSSVHMLNGSYRFGVDRSFLLVVDG